MINRHETLDAASAADSAIEALAQALATLRGVSRAASSSAFADGDKRDVNDVPHIRSDAAHRAENVGNVIGGDTIVLEIARRMKAEGLDELFEAVARSGGIAAHSPIASLWASWSEHLQQLWRYTDGYTDTLTAQQQADVDEMVDGLRPQGKGRHVLGGQ